MSDHFSGPRALAGPAGDICDVYAFPSPERPGHLVLAMTVLPGATQDSSFSDAIVYRFRLRPLAIKEDTSSFSFGPPESELVLACSFEAPRSAAGGATPVQDGWCTAPSGEMVRFRVHDEQGGRGNGLRVYAGLRSDPFFIDLQAYMESLKTGRLAFKHPGQNSLTGFNALSVVVETDCAPLLQSSPLWAVVGETVVAGKIPIRLERFGRPEIKNVIMSMKEYDQVNRDLEIRDLYNLEDAFHMSKDYRGAYRARLNANLAAIDHLGGKTDWPLGPDGSHPLTDLLLADYMVVDVSKPYAQESSFEIEQALLAGRPHETCGGRSLNDHTMTHLYTLLINASHGPQISDGVDQATVPASDVFPYLAPPNPGPPNWGAVAKLIRPQAEAQTGGHS
ncbi:MAG: DUF4331 family protein [Ktedonobacteraceae bacterium]|nr:DUF4331 family protein [Ktedonobacteraceae bacterium]